MNVHRRVRVPQLVVVLVRSVVCPKVLDEAKVSLHDPVRELLPHDPHRVLRLRRTAAHDQYPWDRWVTVIKREEASVA